MVSVVTRSRSSQSAPAVGGAQRIDIQHAAVVGPGFPRHLTRRFIGDGAFAEDGRDAFFLHGVDNLAHLLRGALLVGIDRPQIQFAQAIVAGQIGEGSSLVTSQRLSAGSCASLACSGAIV